MSLLKSLLYQNTLKEDSKNTRQMSLLPNDVVTALKKRIREGAENQEQNWANALELVHKAYEVEGVVRPDPSMTDAWKQYEEMLTYAVQQLAKNRGMDADWRMSSALFHEALSLKKFSVKIGDDTFITEGTTLDDVTAKLVDTMSDINVNIEVDGNKRILKFSKWGIKRREVVSIQEK